MCPMLIVVVKIEIEEIEVIYVLAEKTAAIPIFDVVNFGFGPRPREDRPLG